MTGFHEIMNFKNYYYYIIFFKQRKLKATYIAPYNQPTVHLQADP